MDIINLVETNEIYRVATGNFFLYVS